MNTTVVFFINNQPVLNQGTTAKRLRGNYYEICLKYNTCKQNMHEGQDRVLGNGSWMRGPCPKSTNVTRNKRWCPRVQTPAPTCRAARNGGAATPVASCSSPRALFLLSALGLRATSTMRDRRSLSRVQHTIPGLACSPDKVPVEVRVPQADRQTCRAVR